MSERLRALVLDPADNVAVAVSDLAAGDRVAAPAGTVVAAEPVPTGHKVALRAIASGSAVLKYGEVIGLATRHIDAGAHVHVHNVVSARLPEARDRD